MLPNVVLQRGEGLADPRRIDTAPLPDLAFAPSLPPYHLAEGLDKVIRREPFGEGARDFDGKIPAGDDDRDAIAVGAVERLVCEQQQVSFAFVDPLEHQPDTLDVGLFELRAASRRQLLAKARGFSLETFDLRLKGRNSRREFRWRGPQRVTELAEHAFVIADLPLGRFPSSHFDAANAGADAAVVRNQGQPDLAAALDMCPAAEFTSPVPEGDDPNEIAVLLVEESDRAGLDCLIEWQFLDPAHQVRADPLVEQPGDAIDL